MDNLTGRVAVVTGAASGIGLGIVEALIAEGVHVAMVDIEAAALKRAFEAIGNTNVDVQTFVADVSQRQLMAETADNIIAHFGKLHILCNNAGVAAGGPVQQLRYADWDWCLGVNLHGVINGMQSFLPALLQHGEGGHIINTASILGQVTGAGQAIYSASKYAVVAISEAARADLAMNGIGVSVLCPGMIATNIIKSDRNRSDTRTGQEGIFSEEARDALDTLFQTQGLEPRRVGEQVVHGIRHNRPYIFTHAGLQAVMEKRFTGILAAFDGSEAPGGEFEFNTLSAD